MKKPPSSFEVIVREHVDRYPQMQEEDVYKLCFQAAMGNAHLGIERERVRDRLAREMEDVGASAEAELFEAISPAGLVRVDLRAYNSSGGDAGALHDAMVRTQASFRPSAALLRAYGLVVSDLAASGGTSFGPSSLRSMFRMKEEEGYPAVHHTERYRRLYRPAYRVILQHTLDLPHAAG